MFNQALALAVDTFDEPELFNAMTASNDTTINANIPEAVLKAAEIAGVSLVGINSPAELSAHLETLPLDTQIIFAFAVTSLCVC